MAKGRVTTGWMGADCERCPFAVNGKPPHAPVAGVVPLNPIALLVGEGPGSEEVEAKKPFVGVTGRQLDEELQAVRLPRTKLAIVNAMGCRPPPTKTEGMMSKATTCCRPAFMKQVASLPRDIPTFVMGKWAGMAVTGSSTGVIGKRGFVQEVLLPRADDDTRRSVDRDQQAAGVAGRGENGNEVHAFRGGKLQGNLISSWHPTFAFFRNPYEWGTFSADIGRFARLVRGELEAPPTVNIEPTLQDVERMALEPFIAVDIETGAEHPDRPWTGKDPTRARLKTIALGCESWAVSFRWNGRRDLHLIVKKLMADAALLKVFQNGPAFDIPIMRRWGVRVVNILDTRDMRRVLVSTSKLSLAYLGSIYTDFFPWKQSEVTEEVDK